MNMWGSKGKRGLWVQLWHEKPYNKPIIRVGQAVLWNIGHLGASIAQCGRATGHLRAGHPSDQAQGGSHKDFLRSNRSPRRKIPKWRGLLQVLLFLILPAASAAWARPKCLLQGWGHPPSETETEIISISCKFTKSQGSLLLLTHQRFCLRLFVTGPFVTSQSIEDKL